MFRVNNNNYYPAISFQDQQESEILPPGFYIPDIETVGLSKHLVFRVHDQKGKIVPFTGRYAEVKNQLMTFFSKETAELHKSLQFPHFLGMLLHGKPGTGKSSFILDIGRAAVKQFGAVVLYLTDADDVYIIKDIVKGVRNSKEAEKTPILVVMEEFECYIRSANALGMLLKLQDGFYGIENWVILATTNHIKKIPENLKDRPSRFAIVEEFDAVDDGVIEDFLLGQMALLTSDQLKVARDRVNLDETVQAIRDAKLPIDFVKNILLEQVAYKRPLGDCIKDCERTYRQRVTEED